MFLIRLGIACIVAASALACNEDPGPPRLKAEEQELVDELLAIYRARLLELAETGPDIADHGPIAPELEPRLRELGHEPERAAMVLQAVHDSLELFRDRLLEATQD